MESVLNWPTTPRHKVCPQVLLIINLRNTVQFIIQYITMEKIINTDHAVKGIRAAMNLEGVL